MELTGARLAGLKALLSRMSDSQLDQVKLAMLGGAQSGAGELLTVVDAIGEECANRGAAALALAPLAPLLRSDGDDPLAFPARTREAFWSELKAHDPEGHAQAVALFPGLQADEPVPEVFDRLCTAASLRLRANEGVLVEVLGARAPHFADALALVPVARAALPHLSNWTRAPGDASMAAARLTLRDAVAVDADSAPLLLQILLRHLGDRSHVLRLINAVADHPSDRFLAASEFAPFGLELLNQLESCVGAVRRADDLHDAQGGARGADAALRAAMLISEFETQLQLSKSGPWRTRVAAAKRSLAQDAEQRMRDLEAAVGAALPLQPARVSTRLLKATPKVGQPSDEIAVGKLRAAATFAAATRSIAATAGFGSVRLKVVEGLRERLDTYVEDLLDLIGKDPQHPHAAAYLELAAEVLDVIDGPEAAGVARRRLSAVLASQPSQAA